MPITSLFSFFLFTSRHNLVQLFLISFLPFQCQRYHLRKRWLSFLGFGQEYVWSTNSSWLAKFVSILGIFWSSYISAHLGWWFDMMDKWDIYPCVTTNLTRSYLCCTLYPFFMGVVLRRFVSVSAFILVFYPSKHLHGYLII